MVWWREWFSCLLACDALLRAKRHYRCSCLWIVRKVPGWKWRSSSCSGVYVCVCALRTWMEMLLLVLRNVSSRIRLFNPQSPCTPVPQSLPVIAAIDFLCHQVDFVPLLLTLFTFFTTATTSAKLIDCSSKKVLSPGSTTSKVSPFFYLPYFFVINLNSISLHSTCIGQFIQRPSLSPTLASCVNSTAPNCCSSALPFLTIWLVCLLITHHHQQRHHSSHSLINWTVFKLKMKKFRKKKKMAVITCSFITNLSKVADDFRL